MSAGVLRSAQSLLAGVVALGRTRLELLSAELQEEVARQTAALLGAFVVLMLAACAAVFGGAAALIAAGEAYRLAVALAICALFAVLALAVALALRKALLPKPRIFEASIAQLERDYDALKP